MANTKKKQEKIPRIELIRSMVNAKRYHMDDFWDACPYTLEEICKTRKVETLVYLHVGMVWMRLSGISLVRSGEYFKRDHSTASHAERLILVTLENPKFGKVEYAEIIDSILQKTARLRPTNDVWQDYYACQAYFETIISKKLKHEQNSSVH
jgi:hypothetical protein